jgi:hypothetical protein
VHPSPSLPRAAPGLSAALVFAATITAACSGTGGGGTGDQPSKPIADEFGTCSRLDQVGGPATWVDPDNDMSVNCPKPPDRRVCISGVTVVAIDRFDETGKGAVGNYWVEDTQAPGDFSGYTVFAPSFSPPDLRLAEGDVVDLLGSATEFPGPASAGLFPYCRTLPELSGTMSYRFDGNNPLAPEVIDVTELKTYEGARKHLGKLVEVHSALNAQKLVLVPVDGTPSSGRYTADIDVGGGIQAVDSPKVSNDLFDLECWSAEAADAGGSDAGAGAGPARCPNATGLKAGMTFTSITGVVTYFYGFKVSPRSAADLKPSP